ncbi:MAG: hypothetical protein ABI083_18505 [Lapillicoccus sp.]
MTAFIGRVRPLEGLLFDGVTWGLGVGAGVPLVFGVLGALSGSPDVLLLWGVGALIGAVVGTVVGGLLGLFAGVCFEAWSRVRAPALVVALGTVAPVFVGLYALSGGFRGELLGGWAQGVAILAAGPLVADVLHRARRLELGRHAQGSRP